MFRGLFLENNWDWSVTYPVVHISLGSGVCRSVNDIQITFDEILYDHTKKYGIQFAKKSRKGKFGELIQLLNEKYDGTVVVLIDEYDKPILDNINDRETAIAIREELKNIYSVIKDSDPYLKFVFITGVSKFSKVSLFSGLNNLKDITIDRKYSSICGYTQEGLEIGSPKGVIRGFLQVGLFTEEQTVLALAMVDDRNLTSHTYNEGLAEQICEQLDNYAELMADYGPN